MIWECGESEGNPGKHLLQSEVEGKITRKTNKTVVRWCSKGIDRPKRLE